MKIMIEQLTDTSNGVIFFAATVFCFFFCFCFVFSFIPFPNEHSQFLLYMYISSLDGNKLVQVWNIKRHFCLPNVRRVVNSTLDKMF